MKLRNSLPTLLITAVATFGVVAGCSSKTDKTEKSKTADNTVDPHDIPMTDAEKKEILDKAGSYAAAVKMIQERRDIIKKEATGDVPEKAHRALDELDVVLKALPKIASSDKIDSSNSEAIGIHSQNLIEAFNKVHQNIDDKKAPDYEAVADDIEKSITILAAIKTL